MLPSISATSARRAYIGPIHIGPDGVAHEPLGLDRCGRASSLRPSMSSTPRALRVGQESGDASGPEVERAAREVVRLGQPAQPGAPIRRLGEQEGGKAAAHALLAGLAGAVERHLDRLLHSARLIEQIGEVGVVAVQLVVIFELLVDGERVAHQLDPLVARAESSRGRPPGC